MAHLQSYTQHAKVWGCYAGDCSLEIEFYATLAQSYGRNILALMAATGETAAALANRGLSVTAVDINTAMIEEGRRRYAGIERLALVERDVRDLRLPQTNYDLAFTPDFGHLLSANDCRRALVSIREHLRPGGGLVLPLGLPGKESWLSDWRRFDPLHWPPAPALKIDPSILRTWKEGQTAYDATSRRVTITQEVYIERESGTEQFTHHFQLQLWTQEEMETMLHESGFILKQAYGSYQFEPWTPQASQWIIEAITIPE